MAPPEALGSCQGRAKKDKKKGRAGPEPVERLQEKLERCSEAKF